MQLEGKKVLLTGGAGFIGSHLADVLAQRNELLVVDDLSVGDRDNLSRAEALPQVRFERADVCDREAMGRLCRDVDVVFHLAISCLRTSLANPWLNHDTNAGGSLAVALAARDAEVERLVYVSTSEVYGSAQTTPMAESHPLHPTTVYGASKLAGEHYALACWRTWGLPVVVVRPFNNYGPREPWQGARAEVIPRFILQLEAGRQPVVYGDGSQTRDFTFVEECAAGIARAAACDALVGRAVNVAFGREVSIAEIARHLAALLGRPELEPVYAEPRPGDVLRHFADTRLAREAFGWKPEVDIETGLSRTVDWFRAQRIALRAGADAAGRPNW